MTVAGRFPQPGRKSIARQINIALNWPRESLTALQLYPSLISRVRRFQLRVTLVFAVIIGVAGSSGLSLAAEVLPAAAAVLFEGEPLVLKADVEGGEGPFHYQWFKDYLPIAGGTATELKIDTVRVADSGVYWVTVFNDAGSATSPSEIIEVRIGVPGLLANVSVVGSASDRLSVGFTLGGGSSGLTEVLARAAGPTLGLFNVPGVLADPVLSLFQGGQLLSANDDWNDNPALVAAAASVGAFALPSSSKDSALLLPLGAGSYRAEVNDTGGGSGVTMVELYDARSSPADRGRPRLVAVTARGIAGGASGPLTAGFTIEGEMPLSVLLRGLGPALATTGVDGAVMNPTLSLFREGSLVAGNDDWNDANATAIRDAGVAVGALALAEQSLDAALLLPLSPGSYTVQLSAAGEPGNAQIEVYEVQ